MLLETVFDYRTLIGKCDLGVGLDWSEIEHVMRIEDAFMTAVIDRRRRFSRQEVDLTAIIRGNEINDRVYITELGPGGLVCEESPFITKGEQVEIVIDDGEYSYRFRARGVWQREDGENYRIGLQFIGMPVRLHKVQISEHTQDVVDKISAAA